MALPTKEDIVKMQYVYQAQPFVEVPSESEIDLTKMQYAYQAQPFVRNPDIQVVVNTSRFFHFF